MEMMYETRGGPFVSIPVFSPPADRGYGSGGSIGSGFSQTGGSGAKFRSVSSLVEGMGGPLIQREGRVEIPITNKEMEEAVQGSVLVLMMDPGVKDEGDLWNALLGKRASIATYPGRALAR